MKFILHCLAPPISNARIEKELVVYGILGFIQLQAGIFYYIETGYKMFTLGGIFLGEYMIVITGNQRVGTLLPGCDILRATNFQILPIARNTADKLSRKQLEDEQSYIHLLKNHLKKNAFYYSYKYDVTLSVQKQAELGQPDLNWRYVSY